MVQREVIAVVIAVSSVGSYKSHQRMLCCLEYGWGSQPSIRSVLETESEGIILSYPRLSQETSIFVHFFFRTVTSCHVSASCRSAPDGEAAARASSCSWSLRASSASASSVDADTF